MRPIKAAWKKRNPDAVCADSMRRYTTLLKACPTWTDHLEINKIYTVCQQISAETGIDHEVDHIVPVRGKLVCGLHVPANLRVITTKENRSKNNRFDAAEFEEAYLLELLAL